MEPRRTTRRFSTHSTGLSAGRCRTASTNTGTRASVGSTRDPRTSTCAPTCWQWAHLASSAQQGAAGGDRQHRRSASRRARLTGRADAERKRIKKLRKEIDAEVENAGLGASWPTRSTRSSLASDPARLSRACPDRGYIRELVLHAVVRGVAAAAAPPIHGVHGEMALQRRNNGSPAAVVRGGSVNQQNRRAMAAAKIADIRAVFRPNTVHARSRAPHYRAHGMAASPRAACEQAQWTNFVASPVPVVSSNGAFVSRAKRDSAMPKPRLSASTKRWRS